MKDEIKEIYLSNLKWTKTHDNMGGVMGDVIFKDNMSYGTYQKLLKSSYFVLCDKDYITNLQENYDRIYNKNTQCFHCRHNTVGWVDDIDYENYGVKGKGFVQICHCSNCGADIEYYINLGDEEDD